MIPSDPLQQLHGLDRTSPLFHEQLSDFFRESAYQKVLSNLQSENLARLVEYLDSVSIRQNILSALRSVLLQLLAGISDHKILIFQESLQELGRICGVKQVLPKSCALSKSLLGCVYEGTFNGSKVRIRRIRTYPGGDPQKVKEVST